MKKINNLYYWLGGLVVVALVVGVAVWSQGGLFQGNLTQVTNPVNISTSTSKAIVPGTQKAEGANNVLEIEVVNTPVVPQRTAVAGEEVSLGTWTFKAAKSLVLKDLTFYGYDPTVASNIKLYMHGWPCAGGASFAQLADQTIPVKGLDLALPAGSTTTIEVKGTVNKAMAGGILEGKDMAVQLLSVNKVSDENGIDITSGIVNKAAGSWGTIYTLQAKAP